MTTETTILRITDDTTKLNLYQGDSYELRTDGWAPRISKFRRSTLGGRSPYAEVEERIDINIKGRSPANVLQNVANLNALLERANRFWVREQGDPVYIEYQPVGSRLSQPVRSLIVGSENELILPNNFTYIKKVGYVMSAQVRIRRRGLWIDTSVEAISDATTSIITAPKTLNYTAFDADVLCPMRVSFQHTESFLGNGLFIAADNQPNALPPTVITFTDGVDTADDYGTRESGGSRYVQFFATGVNVTHTPVIPNYATSKYRVFAKLKAETPNSTHRVTLSLYHDSGADFVGFARKRFDNYSFGSGIEIVDFGVLDLNGYAPTRIELTTSVGGGMYLDSLMIYEVTEAVNVVYIGNLKAIAPDYATISILPDTDRIQSEIEQQTVNFSSNGTDYRGDAHFVHKGYGEATFLFYGLREDNQYNPSDITIADWKNLDVTFFPGYLTPQ